MRTLTPLVLALSLGATAALANDGMTFLTPTLTYAAQATTGVNRNAHAPVPPAQTQVKPAQPADNV